MVVSLLRIFSNGAAQTIKTIMTDKSKSARFGMNCMDTIYNMLKAENL